MRLIHRHGEDAQADESGERPSPDVARRDDKHIEAGEDLPPPGRPRFAASRRTSDRAGNDDRDERRADGAPGTPDAERRPAPEREVVVETVKERRDVSSMLAVASGAALIVVGAVALVRTGVDSSWYDPVVQVAGMDHTALLGAVEVAFGALLVLAGLAGARMLAALIALVGGVAATLVAIEPDLVDRELALERGWAVILAVAGIVLALVLVMARGRHVERRIEHRPMTA